MVQAVGELGGLPKWKQAFECYEHCLGELDKLGAVPDHEKRSPASLPCSPGAGRGDRLDFGRPRVFGCRGASICVEWHLVRTR